MKIRLILAAAALVCATATSAAAQSAVVPGQQKADKDGNGVTDAGTNVTAHYKQTIEWVDAGVEYACTYVVNSRGDFGNTPYQDTGWIMNNIRCTGGGATYAYHYMFVQESDPRYGQSPDWPIWGTWEWFALIESHLGNVVKNGR